jgi:hypothetical protein
MTAVYVFLALALVVAPLVGLGVALMPPDQRLDVGRHRAKRRNFFFSRANSSRVRSVRAVAVRQGWTR